MSGRSSSTCIVAFDPSDVWAEDNTPGRYRVTTAGGELRAQVELGSCPDCGAPCLARVNRATLLRFAGCSRFPKCKFSAKIVVRIHSVPPPSPITYQEVAAPGQALDQRYGPGAADYVDGLLTAIREST